MNDNMFEKIDKYLLNEMSDHERLLFEKELATNDDLSSTFNIYKTIETEMRNTEKYSEEEARLKNSLQKLNEVHFNPVTQQTAKVVRMRSSFIKVGVAVAASIIVIVSAYFLFLQPGHNTQKMANAYISGHLTELSQTMGTPDDSLQQGIAAFNNKEYNKALQIFQSVLNNHPDNIEAKEYIGQVYLVTKDYDKALQQFDELADMKGLFSNPGLFLKAITHMKRNNKGDKDEAKQLLQQVKEQKAYGSKEAEEWLKDW